MAGEIGGQIYETLALAKGEIKPGRALPIESGAGFIGGKYRYQLTASLKNAPSVALLLEAGDYFWSPDMFAPWVETLAKAMRIDLPRRSARIDQEYLTKLITPRPEILIQEDRRISEGLTENPLSVKLHEEAALLIGSLALREADLEFMDARPALDAMSAHLALAQASSGELSATGELAEAVLCSLAGRQAAALEIVARLQERAGAPNEMPLETATRWGRALKIYNTGDYRLLDQPEHASLLERLEFFRALRYGVGTPAATAFAANYPLERLAEWSARIMAGGTSVEDGNRWAVRAFETELEDCATAYRAYHSQPLQPENVAQALNVPWQSIARSDSGRVKFEVLGWGGWAQFHQREVCELIENTHYWLDQMLGLPKEAEDFRKKITQRFGSLELFPLISLAEDNAKTNRPTMGDPIRDLVATHPQALTLGRWNKISGPLLRAAAANPVELKSLAPMLGWFGPAFPRGTAYDSRSREGQGQLMSRPREELEALKQIAPYDPSVLRAHLRRTTNSHPTREQTIAQFNELSGYNVWAMQMIADAVVDDPVHYQRVYGLICRYRPDSYINLGNYLRDRGDDAGAARAYQNAVDHAPDRVWVSNSCDWLINYYFDHDRKDDAFRVAKEAAEVYSAGGLAAMASLLERSGDLAQAEEYFRKIDERYEGENELAVFYVRNRDRSPEYAKAARAATAKAFPDDLEPVKISDLSAPPRDGVALTRGSALAQQLGLGVGNVLVAIDGYRIRNKAQYYFVRALKRDPMITYIVWKMDHYVEVKGKVPRRSLGVRIADYVLP